MVRPSANPVDGEIQEPSGEQVQPSTNGQRCEARPVNRCDMQNFWNVACTALVSGIFVLVCIIGIQHYALQNTRLGTRRLSNPLSNSAVVFSNVSLGAGAYPLVRDDLNVSTGVFPQAVQVRKLCIYNGAHGNMQFGILSIRSFKAWLSHPFSRGQTRCVDGDTIDAEVGETLLCVHFFRQAGYLCPGRGFAYDSNSNMRANYNCFGRTSPIECRENRPTRF